VQQPQRSEDDDGDTYKRWKTINNGSPILTGNLRLELVRALNGRRSDPSHGSPATSGGSGRRPKLRRNPSRHDLNPLQRFTRAVCIYLRRRIVARVSRWGARGAVALWRRSIVAPDPGDVFPTQPLNRAAR
jgi:hypothetical protein